MILFSIIIPHKNIPNLLQRCLDSIPRRNDIQIIIVDDNSDESIVDFSNFPGQNRHNVEIYFKKDGKGAGYARNIGLKYAKGQWLLFADADDFFNPCFEQMLNKYVDSKYDLIYFGITSVNSNTLEPTNRGLEINNYITNAIKGDIESQDYVRYKFLYPSAKMIQTIYCKKNNIHYDEIPASNDTMFGVKVASFTNNIAYDSHCIYCLTLRENSLVTSYLKVNLESRFYTSFRLYKFLKKIGKEQYAQSPIMHCFQFRHISYVLCFEKYIETFAHYPLVRIIKETYMIIYKKYVNH